MQGKGKCPLPLQPIPKTNNKTKINNKTKTKTNNKTKTKTNNKTKVVYTEDWTHPSRKEKHIGLPTEPYPAGCLFGSAPSVGIDYIRIHNHQRNPEERLGSRVAGRNPATRYSEIS